LNLHGYFSQTAKNEVSLAYHNGLLYAFVYQVGVFAYDAHSGRAIWNDTTVGGPGENSGMAVGDGWLFIDGQNGLLTGYDALSGVRKFQHKFPYITGWGPVIADGFVYGVNYQCGNKCPQTIWGLDLANHRDFAWNYTLPVISPMTTTLNREAHLIYILGNTGSDVIALNMKTGKVMWRTNLTVSANLLTLSSHTVAGVPVVFVTSPHAVFAYNGKYGNLIWTSMVNSSWSRPTFGNDKIIVHTDHKQNLCLSGLDGEILWSNTITTYHALGSPKIINNVVYMYYDRVLVSYHLETGHIITTSPAPSASEDSVEYLASGRNILVASGCFNKVRTLMAYQHVR